MALMTGPTELATAEPAIRRLAALIPLDTRATEALALAHSRARPVKARRDLIREGMPIAEPLLVLRGWAARVRMLEDGRRQIMSLALPGELIGLCRQPRPLAVSTVVTLTEVEVCPAPPRDISPALDEAYAISQALEEASLLAQITRLGRLNAEERIGDLLLELLERLSAAGLVLRDEFAMPLTQEMLADITGLTSVHVNRTLQLLRRSGEIVWRDGRLTLPDVERLARRVGRLPPRVTESA